jgi:hypothetical protein
MSHATNWHAILSYHQEKEEEILYERLENMMMRVFNS